MADTEKNVWVNTLMEKELADKLDEMVKDNGSTRAAFIRLLIEREYAERKHLQAIKKNYSRKITAVKKSTTPNYPTKDPSPT
jgi:metal-responsive CopG/Arc/MetJ family transcriptional regulator